MKAFFGVDCINKRAALRSNIKLHGFEPCAFRAPRVGQPRQPSVTENWRGHEEKM